MYLFGSSPSLTQITLSGNTALRYGGGMYLSDSSSSLTQITLNGNTASRYGGGMYLSESSPSLTQVTLSGNTASLRGGGMLLDDSSPSLTHVTLSGNTASYGGGMSLNGSSPNLTQVTLSGNTASDYGGGMYLRNGSSPSLTQITLSGNTASSYGGGMYLIDSSPTITNSIIAYNSGSYNVYGNESSSSTFTYSALYDSNGNNLYGLTLDSTNLIGEPGFLETPTWDEDSGMWIFTDLHLALDSPLINAGDPNTCTQQDSSGCDPDGSRSDIGIYGGPEADGWDRDGDGWYDYFWPGTIDDAPQGFDPMDYDEDDGDGAVY